MPPITKNLHKPSQSLNKQCTEDIYMRERKSDMGLQNYGDVPHQSSSRPPFGQSNMGLPNNLINNPILVKQNIMLDRHDTEVQSIQENWNKSDYTEKGGVPDSLYS